jgi:hypothetical protein
MTGTDIAKIIREQQLKNLPPNLDETALTPFTVDPKRMENGWELNKLLNQVFAQEAQRLGLTPERYEYSNINDMYTPDNPIWDTHYFIFDPGDPIVRGLVGNFIPEHLGTEGRDMSDIFAQTGFEFQEVMYILPGVDVGGYGSFHAFANTINPHLKDYNLFAAYMIYYASVNTCKGFDHLVGLIEGVPVEGLGRVIAGDVELDPVREVVDDKLYQVEVKGGKLYMASVAKCHWNLNWIPETKQEIIDADADEIPVRDLEVDTFHFLNGVTPHYFRNQLTEALWTIRRYQKTEEAETPTLQQLTE